MPKTIDIKGVIIPQDEKWIYDFFEIENVSATDVSNRLSEANGDDVIIRINSNGGDIFAGSEIYDLIASYEGNVLIRVVGMAASAASVIAMAAESEIAPTGLIMIHNVRSYAAGDYRDMERSADALKEANRSIMAAYRDKTGLEESELLAFMDNETFMSADTAVERGFINKISDYGKNPDVPENGVQLAASMTGLLPAATIQKFRAERAKAQAQLNLLKIL
ncbi:MAG: Clp protease ClpP [Ruminococcus sp.]|nr:Clp protease ClpP [Ruminococcus sp.]